MARTATVQVLGEQGHPREGLAAVGAGVLLDVGVGLEVSSQVGTVREGSVAERTGERFLARVSADVSLE